MGSESSQLFHHGLDLFNRRDFFECHEVLEEIWTPSRGPERLFLQALIHFAVGFYHHQRQNRPGAERQLRKGLRKLQPYLPAFAGLDTLALGDHVSRLLTRIEAGEQLDEFPYLHPAKSTPPATQAPRLQ